MSLRGPDLDGVVEAGREEEIPLDRVGGDGGHPLSVTDEGLQALLGLNIRDEDVEVFASGDHRGARIVECQCSDCEVVIRKPCFVLLLLEVWGGV